MLECPSLLLDVSQWVPGLDEHTRKRVAQIMKPDAPEPSLFQTVVEVAVLHVVRVHEIPVLGTENPLRDGVLPLGKLLRLPALPLQRRERF
jgi:hypothetical protein